jgi:multiple sugar transport system substrate-binding protein
MIGSSRHGLSRRRLASALAATAGAASGTLAAACGAPGGEQPTTSTAPKTVVYYTKWISGARAEVIKQALAEWATRYPNLQVDRHDLSGDATVAIQTLIAADTMGDLMHWTPSIFVDFAKQGLFVDAAPSMKKNKLSLDDYYYVPSLITHEKKTYGYPFQFLYANWLYNKTLFRNKGIREPADGWTWEDAVQAARALTDVPSNTYGFEQPRDSSVRLYVWPLGGDERTKDNTKTLYDSPEMVEAITFWADVANRQHFAPTPKEAADKKLAIAQGNFGMWFNTASRAFDAQVGGKFEWDVMYSPRNAKTGKRYVIFQDQPHVVTTAAQKHNTVDEAGLLGCFFSGEFVQGVIAKIGDTAPCYKKWLDSDDYLDSKRWNRKMLRESATSAHDEGQGVESWQKWSDATRPELTKALNGEVSPREAGIAATRAGDAVLAQISRK